LNYTIHGPFAVPEQTNGNVARSAIAKRTFWAEIDQREEGLSSACGCYIFAVRAARGIKPYYVGLAESQPFARECFGSHKVNIYNDVLASRNAGTPILMLIAKRTHQGRFARPSPNGHKDASFLESILIGAVIDKNPGIMNIGRTRFLRGMVVPSFMNSPRRRPTVPEQAFKVAIGRE
jgi:hypothetical protein